LEFDGNAALLLNGSRSTIGIDYPALVRMARETDLLLNISGMLDDQDLLHSIPVRAFVDLDPGFVQLWHAQGINMRLKNHTHFVTIGQAIGDATCPIPTCGVSWIHTLQPVALPHWPVSQTVAYNGFTTVGNWRGYGSIQHNGIHYGQKAHSLRQF